MRSESVVCSFVPNVSTFFSLRLIRNPTEDVPPLIDRGVAATDTVLAANKRGAAVASDFRKHPDAPQIGAA